MNRKFSLIPLFFLFLVLTCSQNVVLAETSFKLVSITHDDCYAELLTTHDWLWENYSITGTIFMTYEYINESSYLTQQNISWLMSYGWELASHGYEHINCSSPDSSEADLYLEIVHSKWDLEDTFGFDVDFFAYPYGDYNDHSDQIVGNTYLAGFSAGNPNTYLEIGVEYDFQHLPRHQLYKALESTGLPAVNTTGGWIVLYGHGELNDTAIYDYIEDNNFEVVTLEEGFERWTNTLTLYNQNQLIYGLASLGILGVLFYVIDRV